MSAAQAKRITYADQALFEAVGRGELERRRARFTARRGDAGELLVEVLVVVASGRRPRPVYVTKGLRYELADSGRLWLWSAVGKSGQRWALEPFDRFIADQDRRVAAWARRELERLGEREAVRPTAGAEA